MKKHNSFQYFIFILIVATLACSTATPAATPPQSVDLDTVIAQTAAAAKTQTALVLPTASITFSPTVTSTVTETATPTLTAIPTFTNTPPAPLISVSVSTNCRNGPGKVYDYESALVVGEIVEIFAREESGNYWYIRNPEADQEEYCWIWGKYATISGDTSALPMFTPPPTPTATMTSEATITPTAGPTKKASAASFVSSYNNLDTCNPNWWADFKLRNNGSISFQSLKITVKDLTNDSTFEKTSNVFTDLGGCSTTAEKDVLDPADILLFSGPAFSYDPTGHKLRISITLCEGNGLKGTCAKQNFDVQL